jgi:protein tyrosine/serine phosphatase
MISMLLTPKRMVVFALAFASTLPIFGSASPAGSPEGIKNFYQVDAQVYRGAQPTEDGVKYLAKIGVKTVVDLREADQRSENEESWVTAAGMKYINVPMSGHTPPTDAQISRLLGILESDNGAVFVHCKRGADRTGVVIASYRIDRDGWDNARALSEAKSRGMAGDQFPRMGYIRSFQARSPIAGKNPAQTAGQ